MREDSFAVSRMEIHPNAGATARGRKRAFKTHRAVRRPEIDADHLLRDDAKRDRGGRLAGERRARLERLDVPREGVRADRVTATAEGAGLTPETDRAGRRRGRRGHDAVGVHIA